MPNSTHESERAKRGRPRTIEDPVWFGMKISKHEREEIKELAAKAGKTARRTIMDLVEKELCTGQTPPRLSGKELMALPSDVRHTLFSEQAREAAQYYLSDPDLDFRANDPIIDR